jgi:hypothetical protein
MEICIAMAKYWRFLWVLHIIVNICGEKVTEISDFNIGFNNLQGTWVDQKCLQASLFEMRNSLEFQMLLIYKAEGSGFHAYMTQGKCAEGVQLRHFNMETE